MDPLLAQADGSVALPRLGGLARPDGVVIVSERFWAFAGRDGSLREGVMPQPKGAVRRLPLLRGLVRLSASLAPLFHRRGVAGPRERLVLATAVVAPSLFFLLPPRVGLAAGFVLSGGLLAWMLRGRTLALHGAEHRAIAAVEERRLVSTWAGHARPSRFSPRCGTNFAALVLPVTLLFNEFWPLPPAAVITPLGVTLVSLALTMELWQVVQGSTRRVARVFLVPGLALQRLTTREPSLTETRVALCAVASVLRRELA